MRYREWHDLVILCRKGRAEEALHQLRAIMGKLKLTVNEEKTRICKVPDDEFDFLGFTFGRMYKRTTGKAHSVVASQVQGQATQGRDVSTLAPLRVPRSRAPDSAWARRGMGEGVKSCPRAGCGRSARPVRRAATGNGAMAWLVGHREPKGAETEMPRLSPPR